MKDHRGTKDYIAVLDIGSNAVRLVIFDGLSLAPVRIHNERIICRLGKDLSKTGKLSVDGTAQAMDSLARFSNLIRAMKIKTTFAVATAALRDATDGANFMAKVKKEFGIAIRLIDGDDEARLSAIGVMMNGLGAGGLIGDLGGGSLELISVFGTTVKRKKSLSIGTNRIASEKDFLAREKMVKKALNTVPFLDDFKGQDFYALGGSWRTMARAHMYVTDHPIKVLDHYTMTGAEALTFTSLLAKQSQKSLSKIPKMTPSRIEDVQMAAIVLEQILKRLKPARLVFSGTGLREGLIFDQLTPAQQRKSALIVGCEKMALSQGRFDTVNGYREILRWIRPVFEKEQASFLSILEAACLLSDTAWTEHEDYQASQSFQRFLVAPLYSVDHGARGFIALAQYVRYAGYNEDDPLLEEAVSALRQITGDEMIAKSIVTGLGMRLAYTLTGGGLALLKHAALKITPKYLTLLLSGTARTLSSKNVEEVLSDFAHALGRGARVEKVH